MESLCRSSLHPKTPLFSRRPKPFFSKPSFASPPKPYVLYASNNPSHENLQNPSSFLSVLKPLSLTVATAAASLSILLSRFPFISPSLALASVSSSETLSQSDEIASLRAEMESKIEQGDFMAAVKTLDQLILLEPNNPDPQLLKGHLQLQTGNISSAKRSFEIILQKDPVLVEAYHGLIMVASNSDSSRVELEEMLKRVEKTIELCKNEREKVRDFKLLIAQIKVINGEYEESLKVYGDLEKEDPSDFRPYLCQGIVYAILKNKDEAEKQFMKYKKFVPEGHPYQVFFDDNMVAMKIFGEMEEKKKNGSLND